MITNNAIYRTLNQLKLPTFTIIYDSITNSQLLIRHGIIIEIPRWVTFETLELYLRKNYPELFI